VLRGDLSTSDPSDVPVVDGMLVFSDVAALDDQALLKMR
jgi:hypothetical protein